MNNKKLANRKSVKNAVLELQNGYQKYFEENKGAFYDGEANALVTITTTMLTFGMGASTQALFARVGGGCLLYTSS